MIIQEHTDVGANFRNELRQVIICAGLDSLIFPCSGSTILHRWREGQRFISLTSTISVVVARTLCRKSWWTNNFVGILGIRRSRASIIVSDDPSWEPYVQRGD